MKNIKTAGKTLILILALMAWIFAGGLYAREETEEEKKQEETYNLVKLFLNGSYGEAPVPYEGVSTDRMTIRALLKLLEKAGQDEEVNGLFLETGLLEIGMAKTQELIHGLEAFKKTGKKIYGYGEIIFLNNYLVLATADEIIAPPTAMMIIPGLHAEVSFYKNLLAKLGIVADLEHIGDYKSASDMFTRDSMSEAQREVTNAILDEIFDYMVSTISEKRGLSKTAVSEAIDRAMLTGVDAKALNLVDHNFYRDQLKKEIRDREGLKVKYIEDYGKEKDDVDRSSMAGLLAFFSSLSKKKAEVPEDTPKIGLLYACGMIISGENEESPLIGRVLGDRTTVEALQEMRKDQNIKAVVMRIDSPGGSGLASDMIWREVVLMQKIKPVIVSMSDVAASGGYYIAMAADTIVAQPGTITGSIGVVTGKFSMGGLYEKIGLDVEIVDRGKNASLFSSANTFSESERAVVIDQMHDFYKDFVTKVAKGRNMTYEDVDRVAQGRVWTGTQALDIGLVDQLGGLDTALSIAREKAGLDEEEDYAIVEYPRQKPFFEYLEKMFGGGLAQAWQPELQLLSSVGGKDIIHLMQVVELFKGQRVFYLMPYSIKLVF